MSRIKQLPIALIATVIFASSNLASGADDPTPPPPYVLAEAHGVVIGVTWEEAGIRQALPEGIQPVESMAGGIVIYGTGKGYGLGSYTSAYFYVNVEGYDSREGTKANWMLQGVYGPDERVAKALREHYQLPVRAGMANIEHRSNQRRYLALAGGKAIVSAEIKQKGECAPAQAFENYPALDSETGEVTVLEIPEVGNWCDAEVVTLSINPPDTDPFSQFKVKSVDWAGEFRDWSFSFTRPVSYGKPR